MCDMLHRTFPPMRATPASGLPPLQREGPKKNLPQERSHHWRYTMKKNFLLLLFSLSLLVSSAVGVFLAGAAEAAGEVNLYSYRQPFLIKPILRKFTQNTGIKVNVMFAKKGMLEKIKATPGASDAILTSDIGSLNDMTEAGVLQPIKSTTLKKNIPAPYRHPDGFWFGLTMRARVLFVSKDRVKTGELTSYEDLTKPEFRGRICVRSGKHVYNISLFASIIAHKGEAFVRTWLNGLKSNLARKPSGNDRAQAKAIYSGQCDIAIANTYYMGKMQTNKKKPEQKKWAAAVNVIFPNQGDRGTHVNISGAGVIKSAKNKANALLLIEFLGSDAAQKIYAEDNFEYPIKAGVKLHPNVAGWGKFKADKTFLSKIAENRTKATRIMDKVRFNN